MLNVNLIIVFILGTSLLETPVECIRGPDPAATVDRVKIVIVGGGVSGIATATRLLENGIDDFVILEAQDYYGGRVNTVRFGNGLADLGAQWVHGEEGNVVFDMANPNNLIEKDELKDIFIEPNGNKLDESEVDEIEAILDDISDSASEDLQNYTESIGKYFNDEYPKRLGQNSKRSSTATDEIFDWYQKGLNLDDSADTWFQTSGRSYAEYETLNGSQTWGWKSGGYATVLDLLMKRIPDASKELPIINKLYRHYEVVEIKWDNLHEDHKNKVIVRCKHGPSFIADHVVVTVSLGVLKAKSQEMFKPALTQEKLNSIQGLGYGVVDKIFLEFPSKWWPDNYAEFNFLWDGDDTCKTKILNSNNTEDLDNCWDHFITGFTEVRNQPQVLCGWTYGAAARYMENLTDSKVGEKMASLLQKFIGVAFGATVPAPTSVLKSDWFSNPFFRGSYSYRSMETETKGASAAQLAEPVLNANGKPVLLFAGEATHSTHFSTVHGAIESGWREAERIINQPR